MKTIYKVLLLLAIITLIACEETIELANIKSDKLIGTWINPTPMDSLWRYEKADALQDRDYGFTFKSNSLFVERKNAGWCGTPPITYGNFEGMWTKNNSIINITVDYWGGQADYQWKIISIDDHYLTVYIMNVNYREE